LRSFKFSNQIKKNIINSKKSPFQPSAMAKNRHLKNAPITEAVIDFRTKLPSEFNIKDFLSLKQEFRDRFPKIQERRFIKSEFKIPDGTHVPTIKKDEGIHGYFFRPEDGKKVAQFRIDGFTFSLLKPYTEWKIFRDEAIELWKFYLDKSLPEALTRIALRYINHLEIPLPITNFSEYLTAPPNVPKDLPGDISGFLSKVVISDPKLDISANIIQALEKSINPNYIIIILDIDVYKQKDFGIKNGDIWSTFDKLRDFKNEIFFNSITEKTARLFE
jgi:uncharacterized protein (TIGR04255 family)